MKRVKVDPLRGPEPLQPQARPVNDFYQVQQKAVVKPNLSGANNLNNLANSLKTFSPYLDSLMQRNIIQEGERDKVQAKALAETWANQNKQSWNEFSKSHPEVRKYSPWLPYYYDQVTLKNLKLQLNQELDFELDNNGELRDARDPRTFDQFFDGYVNKFVDKNLRDKNYDERVLPSFYEDFGTMRAGLQKKYTDIVAKRNLEVAKQTTTSYIFNAVKSFQEGSSQEIAIKDKYSELIINADKSIKDPVKKMATIKGYTEALQNETKGLKGASIKSLKDEIKKQMDLGVKNNLSGTDVNELAIQSILSAAENSPSDDSFEATVGLLEQIDTGYGSLMNIGDTAGKVQRLRQRRVEISNAAENKAYIAQKRKAEADLNKAEAEAIKALSNDDIETIQALRDGFAKQGNGASAAKMQAILEHTNELRDKGDPDADADLIIDANDPTKSVMDLTKHKGASRSTYKAAINAKIQNEQEAQNKATAAKTKSVNSIVAKTLDSIDAELTPDIQISIEKSSVDKKKAKAKADFLEQLAVWKEEHPNYTLGELLEWKKKTQAEIVKQYGGKPSGQPAKPQQAQPQAKQKQPPANPRINQKMQQLQQQQQAIQQLQQQLNQLKGRK